MDDGQLIPFISFQDDQYVRIWPIQISLSTVVARSDSLVLLRTPVLLAYYVLALSTSV